MTVQICQKEGEWGIRSGLKKRRNVRANWCVEEKMIWQFLLKYQSSSVLSPGSLEEGGGGATVNTAIYTHCITILTLTSPDFKCSGGCVNLYSWETQNAPHYSNTHIHQVMTNQEGSILLNIGHRSDVLQLYQPRRGRLLQFRGKRES